MKTKGNYRLGSSQLFKLLVFFTFLIAFAGPVLAQGNLMIYPKRVVFEGRKKVEKLVLSNTGKDTEVYSISFMEYKMNENGEMKTITNPEEGIRFASPFVRVFPRVVTLLPGESQTVKVQLYNIQNLTDGEYRSHLYFRAEKNNAPLGQPKQTKDSAISVKLEPIFGLSIACIIRMGEDNTIVSLSDMQFAKAMDGKEDAISFRLNRSGNMSTYGDFSINYIAPDNKEFEVAKMKGVGVYTPGDYRNLKIKMNKPENVNFSGGSLKVVFTQNESKKVLTEAELKL
jgi:hypothetical protein